MDLLYKISHLFKDISLSTIFLKKKNSNACMFEAIKNMYDSYDLNEFYKLNVL